MDAKPLLGHDAAGTKSNLLSSDNTDTRIAIETQGPVSDTKLNSASDWNPNETMDYIANGVALTVTGAAVIAPPVVGLTVGVLTGDVGSGVAAAFATIIAEVGLGYPALVVLGCIVGTPFAIYHFVSEAAKQPS
jgi:hypothetical protein